MGSKEEFERKWLSLRQRLSSKDKIFLEVMTYAFIGTQGNKSDISVTKTKQESIVNGQRKAKFVYEVEVPIEEG